MNATLRERLKSFISESGMSQAKVAVALQYNSGVISGYLNGNYTGNVENVEKAIKSFLDLQDEKKRIGEIDIPFVQIKNAKMIAGIAKRAQLDKKLNMVTGESGMGKSIGAKEVMRVTRGAIMIEVDITYNTKVLLAMILKALNLPTHGSKHSMLTAVVDALIGSNRLLIIDEADLLKTESLEVIRAIHMKANIGILLIGLPELAENMRGSRGEFARLFTRIGGHARLGAISESDAFAIVESYIPGANGLHKVFYSLSKKNARTLYHLIYNAIRVSQENNVDITPDLVEQCQSMIEV